MSRALLLITAIAFMLTSLHVNAMPGGNGNDKKAKSIPPGLQKKVERGGELPPGWQRKLKAGEVLDPAVYDAGIIIKSEDHRGIVDIEVEGRVLRVLKATREIVDILR